MSQTIWIVSGIPGAGKTTVSRLLAATFQRGVHIESDRLQTFIVSGGLWPNEEPREEAMRQLRLRTHHACMLAVSFFDAGFTPVIDDVVLGARLDEFLSELEGRPVNFVLLLPSVEVVELRDATRSEKHVFDTWGPLDAEARRMSSLGLRMDTSEMTAQQTVAEIRRREAEAKLR